MLKVLLFCKEEEIIQALQNRLQKQGHELIISRNGVPEKVKETNPDIIIIDIGYPETTIALDLLSKINKLNIPIIAISNSGQQIELDLAKDLGVKDFITKTEFDLDSIISKIKEIK